MTTLTVEQASALAPVITATDAADRAAAGALLIDVRSAQGRAANGDIPAAVVVAKDEIDRRFRLDSPDRLPRITSYEDPIIVICGSELGSGPSAAQLISLGFRYVAHVAGGFPAWRDAGLPTGAPTS